MTAAPTYIFDLDNTLYPFTSGFFDQIDHKMSTYVSRLLDIHYDQAKILQKKYFMEFGTTLGGLIHHHAVHPREFLNYVHDIDYGLLRENQVLNNSLSLLRGRKIVFTNACATYAWRVLEQLGITPHFEDVFDIVAGDYLPKPHRATYEKMLLRHRINPREAMMFDDIPRNLETARALGIRTVWVHSDTEYADLVSLNGTPMDQYVDHIAYDLGNWLSQYAATDKRVS
jgi:putative hydrolase of the HAD superfamily